MPRFFDNATGSRLSTSLPGLWLAWFLPILMGSSVPSWSAEEPKSIQIIEGQDLLISPAELFGEAAIHLATLQLKHAPTHGQALVGDPYGLYFVGDEGYFGFDNLTVGADLEDTPGQHVEIELELKILPRAIPFAINLDGGGDEPGYYDTTKLELVLCHTAATAGFSCRRHAVEDAQPGWLPVVGDWDGDGRDGLKLFDTKTGALHVFEPSFSYVLVAGQGVPWRITHSTLISSAAGAWPVAGDWHGTGFDQVAFYHSTGVIQELVLGPLSPQIVSWSQDLSFPSGDVLPWPLPWPVAFTGDGVAVSDPEIGMVRFLARSPGGFVTGEQPSSWAHPWIPVAGYWAFQAGGHALLGFGRPGSGGNSSYGLAVQDDRPTTLPLKFPNDPPDP